MTPNNLLALGLLFALCITPSLALWGSKTEGKKVLLTGVSALTLQRGQYTTGRRSSPVPQLSCVGGAASQYSSQIDSVQCYNKGSNGYDVQWKCEADLDKTIKFGKIEVSCEGYEYPDDPYILQGSCGLEYTLEYTSKAKDSSHYGSGNSHHYDYDPYHSTGGSKLKNLVMLALLAFIIYHVYKQCVQATGNAGGARFYGGRGNFGPGGGGDGGGGGPYGGGPSCQPPPSAYGDTAWRPGFFTGLATGGMLGSMFGRRPYYGAGYGTGYAGPSFGRTYGGSSFGSFGGGSRTASGFGGTRRR